MLESISSAAAHGREYEVSYITLYYWKNTVKQKLNVKLKHSHLVKNDWAKYPII